MVASNGELTSLLVPILDAGKVSVTAKVAGTTATSLDGSGHVRGGSCSGADCTIQAVLDGDIQAFIESALRRGVTGSEEADGAD